MLAVHGNGKQAKQAKAAASSREASTLAPEASLTWCLAQLVKAGNAAGDQRDGGTKLDNREPEKVKEAEGRARAGLWRALVAIRTKHIKGGSAGIARYRVRGGLQPLLQLLRHPACARKTLDLALSILANCCTESETRVEVRKLGGITLVVEVLKKVPVETVQNRAARALGNLAIDPENSSLIHLAGGVPPLILCLSTSSSSSSPSTVPLTTPCPKLECAQSAARALLYLSDTPSNRLSLLSQGALPALVLLIAPEYPPGLRRASLRALNELTRSCSAECAREVSRSGALAQLGVLALDESGQPLKEIALKTLANLCSQGCLRPLVGSLGVIQKFVEEVKKAPLKSGMFFRALCLCCKEAVNRVKVKESGGLEVLTGFLSRNQSHPLARLAVLAFVDFVYDESALEQLQGLGLVPLLVSRLVGLAKGEEPTEEVDTPLSSSSCPESLAASCFDSFDFPPPEGNKKEEGVKELGQGSSSFLSLRSWLLSEGLISCEGELLSPPASGEGSWGSPCPSFSPPTPLSDRLSPLTCSSPTLTLPLHSSTPAPPSPSAPSMPSISPSPLPPSSSQKRAAISASSPLCPPPSVSQPNLTSSSSPLSFTPPSHKPKPSSPCRPSSPPKKQPQTPSTNPSSSIPPDTFPAPLQLPAYNHPYHPEPWTTESPILLLLSRFSQSMDPSSALINSGIISGLLYYLTQHKDPSPRCFRMLCRLSCNPNCLQGLIRTGSVALIQHRLWQGEGEREEDRQKERVKANIQQLGKALLNNLRSQCESSFGSGVLTHIMLSGSDTDRVYCALSLPLINSNKPLLKKLLLDNGGLQLALEHLGSCEDNNDHTLGYWRSLSNWLYPHQQSSPKHLRSLYFSLLTECLSCLMGHPKLELDKKGLWLGSRPGVNDNTSPVGSKTQSHLPPPLKKPCLTHSCPYHNSNFDVIFLLDDGSQVAANRNAVAGEDGSEKVGSEYFRALLKGGFGEAKRSGGEGIPIRDVTAKMLLPVLHYLHGCCVNAVECEGDQEQGVAGQREVQKDSRKRGKGKCCMVLQSLAAVGLGKWLKSGEGQMELEEGEGFQNSPLAEAMMGASRFLVCGLQRELEDLCVFLLQSSAAPQPAAASCRSSEDSEKLLTSAMDCGIELPGSASAGKSWAETASGEEAGRNQSSVPDSDFEVSSAPSTQATELQSKAQLGFKTKSKGQLHGRHKSVTETGLDKGSRKNPKTQSIVHVMSREKCGTETDLMTSDFQLESVLDSRSGMGSATRLDFESESAMETEPGFRAHPGGELLKQMRSDSLSELHCQLLFSRKEEDWIGGVDSNTVVNSKLQLKTLSPLDGERCKNSDRSEAAMPAAGSRLSSTTLPCFRSGTGSDTKPVNMAKAKLNSGSRLHSQSASMPRIISGSSFADPISDFISDHRISSHSSPHQDSTPGSEFHSSPSLVSTLDRDQLESVSDAESVSNSKTGLRSKPTSDVDRDKWSLLVSLPELYCFSQLHSYPRLGQMCLSVLLWQQSTSPNLPLSLTADCLSRLARSSHCIETLKRDLLTLVAQALN